MRARAAASVLLAGLASATLAGCTFVTPIATQYEYAPSDGVQGEIGEVRLLNVLVLTEDGTDGNLLLTAANDSADPIDLTIEYEAGGERVDREIELPPFTATDIGFGESGQFLLEGLDTTAGALAPIYFQYGEEPGVELPVPVLDGSLPHYADLLPMPVPTVEPTATPGPTSEPEPETTPEP